MKYTTTLLFVVITILLAIIAWLLFDRDDPKTPTPVHTTKLTVVFPPTPEPPTASTLSDERLSTQDTTQNTTQNTTITINAQKQHSLLYNNLSLPSEPKTEPGLNPTHTNGSITVTAAAWSSTVQSTTHNLNAYPIPNKGDATRFIQAAFASTHEILNEPDDTAKTHQKRDNALRAKLRLLFKPAEWTKRIFGKEAWSRKSNQEKDKLTQLLEDSFINLLYRALTFTTPNTLASVEYIDEKHQHSTGQTIVKTQITAPGQETRYLDFKLRIRRVHNPTPELKYVITDIVSNGVSFIEIYRANNKLYGVFPNTAIHVGMLSDKLLKSFMPLDQVTAVLLGSSHNSEEHLNLLEELIATHAHRRNLKVITAIDLQNAPLIWRAAEKANREISSKVRQSHNRVLDRINAQRFENNQPPLISPYYMLIAVLDWKGSIAQKYQLNTEDNNLHLMIFNTRRELIGIYTGDNLKQIHSAISEHTD